MNEFYIMHLDEMSIDFVVNLQDIYGDTALHDIGWNFYFEKKNIVS